MALPKLKAPAGDGELLAVPPLKEWPGLVERNRRLLAEAEAKGQLRHEWRTHTVEANGSACDLNRRLGLPESGDHPPRPAIVTGHQAELFHSGVWIKNFAAHRLAKCLAGSSFNLIVDTDLTKSTALAVPDAETGERTLVPFDEPGPAQPIEEQPLRSSARFHEALGRLHELGLTRGSFVRDFWNEAERCAARTPLLGEILAGGRLILESDLGHPNRDLLLSMATRFISFIQFTTALLTDLPRFVWLHNQALTVYRRRHRLRSRTHPVPDLEGAGEWLEAPLWVWKAGGHHRHRLFVRPYQGELRLRAGKDGEELPFAVPTSANPQPFVPWWQLHELGWKLRSRALLTTLYARLCLSDLFIHGLGGGLYDEMTDEIIRGFFGIEPPAYVILTGTLRLNDPAPSADAGGSSSAIRRLLRDTHYNPDRFLPLQASSRSLGLVREKAVAIATLPETKPDRLVRFNRLHELNEQLRPKTSSERERLEAQLQQALTAEARARVFNDREYAFILHSKANMQRLIDQLIFD